MKNTKTMRLFLAAALTAVCVAPARAQLNGENLLGDMGVRSGTQPAPGFYAAALYYRYNTGSIRDGAGSQIPIEASQTINAIVPIAAYVTPLKVFGANYGMMAVMPFANGSVEVPGAGVNESASTGPSDLYIVPVQLGWHFKRADVTASFGLFAPTGRYSAGASDNLGKGMWSYELAAGTTLYLDERRSWSFATTAFWELHSKKEGEVAAGDATIKDVKVGQLMTLEGGLAKSFLSGAAHVGFAYYAQWKLTADDLGSPIPAPVDLAKHRVFAIGPDVTLPIAIKSRLVALVNARYLWETDARVKTQGNSLLITTTFPVPGIRIKPAGH